MELLQGAITHLIGSGDPLGASFAYAPESGV
jgi:hypothetical protein